MSKRQHPSGRRFLGSKQGLLFLVFAAVIWLLSALSETYTAVVPIRVELQENSNDLVLLQPKIDVPVRLSGSGFFLAYRQLFPQKIRFLTSDLPMLNVDRPSVEGATLFKMLQKKHADGNAFLGVTVDTILLPIVAAAQKSFSPTLLNPPSLAEGYQLTSPLKFSVDSVTVFGSRMALDKLEKATFVLEKNKDIKADFDLQATLVDSLLAIGQWSVKTLTVSAQVDRYSEVSFVLPISLKNTPPSKNLTITPKQVTVKFAAPLNEIRSLRATDLSVEVDFTPNTSGQLPVKVVGLSSSVKQLVVEPSVVHYFIVE